MITFLLCVYHLFDINIYHHLHILTVPPKRIISRFRFVRSSMCLISPLFPHIEEVLIDEIIIIHEPLLASFFFSSFHFFRVRMIIVVMTLLAHGVQILVVIQPLLWINQSLVCQGQLLVDVSLAIISGDFRIVIL